MISIPVLANSTPIETSLGQLFAIDVGDGHLVGRYIRESKHEQPTLKNVYLDYVDLCDREKISGILDGFGYKGQYRFVSY